MRVMDVYGDWPPLHLVGNWVKGVGAPTHAANYVSTPVNDQG